MAECESVQVKFEQRTFLVVTGASRGLGRAIAIGFAKKLSPESFILLLSRDVTMLEETRKSIESVTSIEVSVVALDLSYPKFESYEQLLRKSLKESNHCGMYEQVILVHNAGSLGDISKGAAEFTSVCELQEYFSLNFYSAVVLSSAFLSLFKGEKVKNRIVINISSLAAIKPFKGWSLYCTGKASRDMYFKVLAEEDSSVLVLNYSPGPLITDMYSQIIEQAFPDIRQWFINAKAENQMLTCEFTVSRLISILENGKFKSGDHVDVFDKD